MNEYETGSIMVKGSIFNYMGLFFSKPKSTTNAQREMPVYTYQIYSKFSTAIVYGNYRRVISLLQCGVNPNALVPDSMVGHSYLQYAIMYKNLKIIRLLLIENASPTYVNYAGNDSFAQTALLSSSTQVDHNTISEIINLLHTKYSPITLRNIKSISKYLVATNGSCSLEILPNEVLEYIISFLFTDERKTQVFLKYLQTRVPKPKL